MKKYYLILVIFLALLNFAYPCFAKTPKIITLKDGSIIKGEVIQLVNGTYTIKTANLGEVNILEADVVSVSTEDSPAAPTSQNQSLQAQAQEIQTNLLSDPDIMQEIQGLMQDEEMRAVFTDPIFMKAIFSYNTEAIKKDEKTQYLLRNPKFQSLMQKIQNKLLTPTAYPAQE